MGQLKTERRECCGRGEEGRVEFTYGETSSENSGYLISKGKLNGNKRKIAKRNKINTNKKNI